MVSGRVVVEIAWVVVPSGEVVEGCEFRHVRELTVGRLLERQCDFPVAGDGEGAYAWCVRIAGWDECCCGIVLLG